MSKAKCSWCNRVHDIWDECDEAYRADGAEDPEVHTFDRFQGGVKEWVADCLGEHAAADHVERNYRFLEEALELVQACGCTAEDAYKLVDYVFARPVGDKAQEVGGTMTTLAALCNAHGIDVGAAAFGELARVQDPELKKRIRAKQESKPMRSPLPGVA